MTNEARFLRADRLQTRWDFIDLEALLPSGHRARIVWSFVETLGLSPCIVVPAGFFSQLNFG